MLIMRLTVILLLAVCLQVNATAVSQTVTLTEHDASLELIFKKIEKQTGYTFVYRDELLRQAKKVTIEAVNQTMERVLELCFKDQPLSYSIVEKTVVVSAGKKAPGLITEAAAPPIVVKGVVSDPRGKPLEGVSVSISSGGKGTVTNAKGEYTISVEPTAVLVFSYVSMQTARMPVEGKTIINIVLKEDMNQLEEMVIKGGYGTRELKENQVGSAVRISAEDLMRKPTDRIDRLLDGLVPGLQYEQQDMTQSSSRPRFQVRIRGEGSFDAANDPLWVIDGVPLFVGGPTNLISGVKNSISPLTYMDPSEIESVTVLKDATATTIYGANGANGVILVTTKSGAANKDRISYGFRTGVNLITDNKFQLLNGTEYRELVKEAYANSGQEYPFNPEKDQANTDWYDVFFRTGITTQHNLSFSGGTAKTKYYVSGGYFKEKMTMIANETDRINLRMNLDQQVNKWLDVKFIMGGAYTKNKLFSPGTDYFTLRPNLYPYNPDGTFLLYDSTGPILAPGSRYPKFLNSVARAYQNDDNQSTISSNGSIGGTVKLAKGLTFNTTNGIEFYNIREDNYLSNKNWSGMEAGGEAYRGQTSYLKWISINRLNYSKTFDLHDVSGVVATEAMSDRRSNVFASGTLFAHDDIREVSFAPDEKRKGGSNADENSAMSYIASGSYTYDRRYSLTTSFRRDGNSRFGKDVRWANFMSVGAAWTLSNDIHWKSEAITFAKLKISYGTNGNSRINSYAKGLYGFNDIYSYNGKPGAVLTTGANPQFKWEITYLFNTGIDLTFFDRIEFAAEYYEKQTEDLIDEVDVSRTTGQTQIYQNVGSVRNAGIEFSVNSLNIKTPVWEWRTRFNLARNKNKILNLYNDNSKTNGDKIQSVGSDANTFYLVRWAGVDPRDGMPMWYDVRGNITKDFNTNDRVGVGSSTPEFFGGMTNTVSYKGFTLSALVNYMVGGYAFSGLRRGAESDGYLINTTNQSRNILDRWKEPGDLSLTPKLLTGSTSSSRNSTRFLHKKTSLRLNNISLNYRLPKTIVSRAKLADLSAYVQADNLGIWTPYESGKNRNTYRNSFSSYPMTTTISFGIMAGF